MRKAWISGIPGSSEKEVLLFPDDTLPVRLWLTAYISSGASSNKLDDDDFKRQRSIVYCLEEQQKIADCLSSFDEVIEKQKATLSAWEELKKGLLQQMFV